ncbi:MAG: ribosome rescue protein RqcH [Thermosphaera sp.]
MLKKSMDILDTYSWVCSNSRRLVNCYVDNVYFSKSKWLLKLRCKDEGTVLLHIQPGVRINSSPMEPAEKTIDNFARFLRSRIRDGRIGALSMPKWERIIEFIVERRGERVRNLIELLPRGLWVVSDENYRIMYASKIVEYKDREIRPGVEYTYPPLKGVPPSSDSLIPSILSGKDLVRSMVFNWGLPGHIAEEILYRSGLLGHKTADPKTIPPSDLELLANRYREVVKEAEQGKGYLIFEGENIHSFTAYKPLIFIEKYELSVKELKSIDEAIDTYFTRVEATLELLQKEVEMKKTLDGLNEKLLKQQDIISKHEGKLNEVINKLSLIYDNYQTLEELLDCAKKVRDEKGWEYVKESCKGIVNVVKDKGEVEVLLNGSRVALSLRAPLEKQVIELEKTKGELKKKIETALKILEEIRSEYDRVKVELDRASSFQLLYYRPKSWYEKFHWLITRNGFLTIGGRDASQNEMVVKKYLKENDIFLHADIHGGSAAVLFTDGKEPSLEDIRDAALIPACYSKAWKSGVGFIEVFWTRGSNVSLSPPPGEYLPKGSIMVYGKKNYVKIPLKMGIGLDIACDDTYGSYYLLFILPEDLVKDKSLVYAVLEPGDEPVHEIAEEIAEGFSNMLSKKYGFKPPINPKEVEVLIPGKSVLRMINYGEKTLDCKE